jgi:hypothetical protein
LALSFAPEGFVFLAVFAALFGESGVEVLNAVEAFFGGHGCSRFQGIAIAPVNLSLLQLLVRRRLRVRGSRALEPGAFESVRQLAGRNCRRPDLAQHTRRVSTEDHTDIGIAVAPRDQTFG